MKKKVQVVVMAQESLLLFEFNPNLPHQYVGFQNITGSVENEEDFFEAANRELLEEAGISSHEIVDAEMEFTFLDRWKNHCVEKVFWCYFKNQPPITLSEEHTHCKWVAFDNVQASDYTFPSNYEAFLIAKNQYLASEKP